MRAQFIDDSNIIPQILLVKDDLSLLILTYCFESSVYIPLYVEHILRSEGACLTSFDAF